MVAEIVFREFLGYTVETPIVPNQGGGWGDQLSSGIVEIDVEVWQASTVSTMYKQHVVKELSVLDAGLLGYTARSGIYALSAVQVDAMSDYYTYYQNATSARLARFLTFGESTLEAQLGDNFPACNPNDFSWCGSYGHAGYWIPPQCHMNPSMCLEVAYSDPFLDRGYFEQLVRNYDVAAAFGYYGYGGMVAHVLETAASGRNLLFHGWYPDAILIRVNATRIAFPPYHFTCDRLNNRNPDTGNVTCDFGDLGIRKLSSRSVLARAPEAYAFLTKLTLEQNDIDWLIGKSEEGGGSLTNFDSACLFVRENLDRMMLQAPRCIVYPIDVVFHGDLVFNAETLECENATIFPKLLPAACAGVGWNHTTSADNRHRTVRIVRQDWLAHTLVSMLTELLLRDYLGFNVEAVYNNVTSPASWGADLADGHYDVDMAHWQLIEESLEYAAYIATEEVLIAGLTGFARQSGVFVTRDVISREPTSKFYRIFQNATLAASAGFIRHQDSPLRTFSSSYPACTENEFLWCGTGALEGYWSPARCSASPGSCIELAHSTPFDDTGYVEQMIANNDLEIVVAYYGVGMMSGLMSSYSSTASSSPFYWYEPDAALFRVNAERVVFPSYRIGCDAGNTGDPSGSVACDFPEVFPVKLVHSRLNGTEVYYVLERIELYRMEMDSMLRAHIDGGGNLTAEGLICDWLATNQQRVADWIPSCLSHPIPVQDVTAGDMVFQPQDMQCVAISCPAHKVITYGTLSRNFFCTSCGVGQVPDERQVDCLQCPPGLEVSADGSVCLPCSPGRAKTAEDTACLPCEAGWYTATSGQSHCSRCNTSSFQDQPGASDCKACDSVILGSITQYEAAAVASSCLCRDGTFLPLNASICEPCPAGMLCKEGSSMRNFYAATSDDHEYPVAQKGFMTRLADPLLPYRCIIEDACPGGGPGSCGAYRKQDAVGCGACVDGAYVSSTACRECTDLDWIPTVALVAILMMVAVAVVSAVSQNILMKRNTAQLCAVLFGLVVTTAQVLSVITDLDVAWFSPLDEFTKYMQFVSFNLKVVRITCVLGTDPVKSYLMKQLMVPAAVPVLYFLVHLKKRLKLTPQSSTKMSPNIEFINGIGMVFNVFFISIIVSTAAPHVCYEHPNSAGWSVVSESSIMCDLTGDHLVMVLIGIGASLLVPCPFLAVVTLAIWQYPKVVRSRQGLDMAQFLKSFRFLFWRFTPAAYWFGLLVCIRNLSLCLIPAILYDPALQVLAMAVNFSLYVFIVQGQKPWRSYIANGVDIATSLLVLLVLTCIAILTDFPTADGAMRVLVSSALVLALVCPIGVGIWAQYQALRTQAYLMFICHHKAAAAAQARLLKMFLVAKTQRKIFIDSDNLVELDGLFDIVKSSVRTLLVYLTRDTLTRAWCAGEIATAYATRKDVRCVRTASWEDPQDSSDLYDLIDQSGCNLEEQGIAKEAVVAALHRLVQTAPSITVDNKLPGTKRFVDLVQRLLLDANTARTGNVTRKLSTKELKVENGGIFVSADATDDEAIGAAGILSAKLDEQVLSLFGVQMQNSTEFGQWTEGDLAKLPELYAACRAVIIVLSRRSLESQAQVAGIAYAFYGCRAVVPVNLWDFAFPTSKYYDEILPNVWKIDDLALPDVQHAVRSFFKLIAVFLATMASDSVIDTQVQEALSRIPRTFSRESDKSLTPKGSSWHNDRSLRCMYTGSSPEAAEDPKASVGPIRETWSDDGDLVERI